MWVGCDDGHHRAVTGAVQHRTVLSGNEDYNFPERGRSPHDVLFRRQGSIRVGWGSIIVSSVE